MTMFLTLLFSLLLTTGGLATPLTCNDCIGNLTFGESSRTHVWCSTDNSCRPIDPTFPYLSQLKCVPNCYNLPDQILSSTLPLFFIPLLIVVVIVGLVVGLIMSSSCCSKRFMDYMKKLIHLSDGVEVDNMDEIREIENEWLMKEEYTLAFAFSGGGVRAAAFALGVLCWFAKQRQDLLDKLSVISSVSGGGCTAAGFWASLPPDPAGRSRGQVFAEAAQQLKDRLLQRPSYLKGSTSLMILVICVSFLITMIIYATISFAVGILIVSLCTCGSAEACGSSWYSCPNLQCTSAGLVSNCASAGYAVSEQCPSSDLLRQRSHFLFDLSRHLLFLLYFLVPVFTLLHVAFNSLPSSTWLSVEENESGVRVFCRKTYEAAQEYLFTG